MAKLFNLARVTTATTGTGTITLGSAASGHLTFANAGVTDGQYVTYGIIDGTESEVGRGLYTSSGTTLTRSVITSTNSNSAINLSGTAEVFITSINSDFNALPNTSGQYNVLLAAGTNVTADRTLTLTTGDANRTLDISAGSVTISTAGANLIDDADASAQRTTLGLGTMALETAASYSTTAAIAAAYQPLDAQLTDVAGLAVTDGNFIVGNGTNFVAESGNTARTSLGLGTSDSPEFTAVSIDDADTTITRVSAGLIAVEGDTVALLNASQTLANKTLTAPALGTPASGTLTNCTGLPVATGISGLGSNVATFLATPSSANLASALTDETGSGAAVFGTAPTITNSLTVTSTDAGTGAAPDLVLWRNSASPADNDILGQIKFDGEDSAGNQQTYGTISGQILDEASTSEDGSLLFGVTTAGSLANELVLYGTSLSPVTTNGLALGTSSLMWSDLFLASSAVINFDNGNTTLTHSNGQVTLSNTLGATLVELNLRRLDAHGNGVTLSALDFEGTDSVGGVERYARVAGACTDNTTGAEVGALAFWVVNAGTLTSMLTLTPTAFYPTTSDNCALGTTTRMWSDLFLASGSVINFNAGDVTITHSTDVLTVGGGDLRVTTAGTNTASVVTVGGTQTLTNKTLTSPTLTAPLTVANGGTGQATEAEAVGELIQALTADSSPDNAADYIATYDASADTGKKVLLSTIVRERLSANRTYYVRTDGSNSNTGLTDSSGGAFLTIQKAVDVISTLDIVTYTVTIKISQTGTYTGEVTVTGPWLGSGTVLLQGDTTTPANTLISNSGGILVKNSGRLSVQGFKITTSSQSCLTATSGAVITLVSTMDFGSSAYAHLDARANGVINCDFGGGNRTISGGAYMHMYADVSAAIDVRYSDITLTGTPAFSAAFAYAQGSAAIIADGWTIVSGTATGARYAVYSNGSIATGGGGASYFPGNAAGTTTPDGEYS